MKQISIDNLSYIIYDQCVFVNGINQNQCDQIDIESIVVPEFITIDNEKYDVYGLAPYCFKGNEKIKHITLPYNLKLIGTGAFFSCSSLETIISYGAIAAGDNAFAECPMLSTIMCNSLKYIGLGLITNTQIELLPFLSDKVIIPKSTFIQLSESSNQLFFPVSLNFDSYCILMAYIRGIGYGNILSGSLFYNINENENIEIFDYHRISEDLTLINYCHKNDIFSPKLQCYYHDYYKNLLFDEYDGFEIAEKTREYWDVKPKCDMRFEDPFQEDEDLYLNDDDYTIDYLTSSNFKLDSCLWEMSGISKGDYLEARCINRGAVSFNFYKEDWSNNPFYCQELKDANLMIQKRNFSEGFSILNKLASENNAIALYYLAKYTFYSIGLNYSPHKVIYWLKKSSQAGLSLSGYILGEFLYQQILYNDRLDIIKDKNPPSVYYEEALDNAKKESEAGSGLAYLIMGDLYYHGYGTESDEQAAKNAYEKAELLNNYDAMIKKAQYFGTKDEFYKINVKLAKEGFPRAKYYIARFEEREYDPIDFRRYSIFTESSDQGDILARYAQCDIPNDYLLLRYPEHVVYKLNKSNLY